MSPRSDISKVKSGFADGETLSRSETLEKERKKRAKKRRKKKKEEQLRKEKLEANAKAEALRFAAEERLRKQRYNMSRIATALSVDLYRALNFITSCTHRHEQEKCLRDSKWSLITANTQKNQDGFVVQRESIESPSVASPKKKRTLSPANVHHKLAGKVGSNHQVI